MKAIVLFTYSDLYQVCSVPPFIEWSFLMSVTSKSNRMRNEAFPPLLIGRLFLLG